MAVETCRACDQALADQSSLNDHIDDNPDCWEEYADKCPNCGQLFQSMPGHWKESVQCRARIARALDERARRRANGELETYDPDHVDSSAGVNQDRVAGHI